jgi:hypothetical protein
MKIITYIFFSIFVCFISGCAVYGSAYNHSVYGTFDPSPHTDFLGKISYEPGGDYLSHMRNQCASYGGLDMNSIQDTTSKLLFNNFGLVKEYRCKGLPKIPVQSLQASQVIERTITQPEIANKKESSGISMTDAQNKCRDLGFTPKTEGFGKCVLQLTK